MAAGGRKDAAMLVEGVENYVDNHPGALKNAANKALNGLSQIFSRNRKGQIAQAAAQATAKEAGTSSAAGGSEAVSSAPVVIEESAFEARWAANPWMIAGVATLTAAVCAGVAVGVVCFARIQHVQMAREPLLAGGPMQGTLPDEAAGEGEVVA